MKKIIVIILFYLICNLQLSTIGQNNNNTLQSLQSQTTKYSLSKKTNNQFEYYNADLFEITGQLPGIEGYTRLPLSAKGKVKNQFWLFSQHSSGLGIKFVTNSSAIKVRWKLKFNSYQNYFTSIAVKGLDLYALLGKSWQFVGIAIPTKQFFNESLVIEGMDSIYKEFILNLPLFDGVNNLEIGIVKGCTIECPKTEVSLKPSIVIYGTSITQGASASRPGMSYPAILSRCLNKNVINLGFSGYGKFEKDLTESIMTAKPELIILECVPNSEPEEIEKNAPDFINSIREIDKKVPILLIESIMREDSYLNLDKFNFISSQNEALRKFYKKYKKGGDDNIYYLTSNKLIGNDHEGTIDGTHLTDLGFTRISKAILRKIDEILITK